MDKPLIEGKDCKSTFSKAVILSPPALDERNQNMHSPGNQICQATSLLHCAALSNVRVCGADTENDEETQGNSSFRHIRTTKGVLQRQQTAKYTDCSCGRNGMTCIRVKVAQARSMIRTLQFS